MTDTIIGDTQNMEKPSIKLLPLKRKRDDEIQGPEIYSIFINNFIDILANSPQNETIRQYHSIFHVNKSAQTAFLTSASLTFKREQFEFAKCLEGFSLRCEISIQCPETNKLYKFRFEPPEGIILHLRSKYCKMIFPEDVAVVFNTMMNEDTPNEDDPLCPMEDFQRIWRLFTSKVNEWPDECMIHQRHMGNPPHYHYNNKASNDMYTRMGYKDITDPTPVSPRTAHTFTDALIRIENWKKREESRSSTRFHEIEKERAAAAVAKVVEEEVMVLQDGMKHGRDGRKPPEKLRRSARLLGKI